MRDAVCDVGFLANEPQRADHIAFSESYLGIDAAYLVATDSSVRQIADVDRPGIRIVVVEGAAYELWLTRNIKHATLLRARSVAECHRLFSEERIEVMAGLRKSLSEDVNSYPGSHVLPENFTLVQQSIAVPKQRPLILAFLNSFVQDLKAAGQVGHLIQKHRVEGVSAAK